MIPHVALQMVTYCCVLCAPPLDQSNRTPLWKTRRIVSMINEYGLRQTEAKIWTRMNFRLAHEIAQRVRVDALSGGPDYEPH